MSRGAISCCAALACAVIMAGCGGSSPTGASSATTATTVSSPALVDASGGQPTGLPRAGDWPRFDYDPQRSGVGPLATGITAANVHTLVRRVVRLDGTVDSSPIELHAVPVRGRARDLVVVTTTYGHTIAIDASTGERLWEYRSRGTARLEGTSQVTTATPVADPDRRHVYAASPDGLVHELLIATGQEVRARSWPARVTLDPKTEKIGGALNLSGRYVLAVVGGHIEDVPTAEHYQGHVVAIDRGSGKIEHVFNALCSDRRAVMVPSTCSANDAGVWGRSGVVVEPGSGRLLVATGNGHFNGRTRWGDSVLELAPDASRLLHNWTPANQAVLDRNDTDIGSTAPAILPPTGGRLLLVQGGKDGALRLLDLDRLNGTTGSAGPRTSGELQTISSLGGGMVFTAPAVWTSGGHVYIFVGDVGGLAGYTITAGPNPRLVEIWGSSDTSTSPIVAGGLLYAFDLRHKSLDVRSPQTGSLIASFPAAVGHWNSPIAINGRVVLPVGDYQKHLTSGELLIYHLPGR